MRPYDHIASVHRFGYAWEFGRKFYREDERSITIKEEPFPESSSSGKWRNEPGGRRNRGRSLYLASCNKTQIPVVEQAIETAALILGTDKSRGYCLEMIAQTS